MLHTLQEVILLLDLVSKELVLFGRIHLEAFVRVKLRIVQDRVVQLLGVAERHRDVELVVVRTVIGALIL